MIIIYKKSQIKLDEFNKVIVTNYIRLIVNLHVESFMKTLHGLKEYDVICTQKMGAVVGPPLFNLIPESLSSNNYLSIILHGSYWNRMNNYRIRGSLNFHLWRKSRFEVRGRLYC